MQSAILWPEKPPIFSCFQSGLWLTVQLDYYPFGSKKGVKIYVRFQSTNSASFLEKNDNNFSFKQRRRAYVGSYLYIDDIELIY